MTAPVLAGDPGARVVPGASAFSEWRVKLGGVIATCVESSELVLLHIKQGLPLTANNDIALTTALQQAGLAGPGGATNWAAASQQLSKAGVPNKAYGPADISTTGLIQLLIANAGQQPILVGLSNAWALKDDWTGNSYNKGVYGHAIVVVGEDSSGFIVADPNTPQALSGQFVHYSISSLRAASADSLVIPTGPSLGGPGAATDPLSAGVGVVVAATTTVPGFAPVAQALDDAEQFYGFDLTQPVHSVVRDIGAFCVRGIIVLLGVILIVLVIFSLLRRAAPALESAGQIAALTAE